MVDLLVYIQLRLSAVKNLYHLLFLKPYTLYLVAKIKEKKNLKIYENNIGMLKKLKLSFKG